MLPAPTTVPADTVRRAARRAATEGAAAEQIFVGIIAVPESASAYLILSDIGEEPLVLTEEERTKLHDTVAAVCASVDYPELSASPTWRTDYCAYLGRDGFDQVRLAQLIITALNMQSLHRFAFIHCMCESSPKRDCQQMGARLAQALRV